MPAPSLQARAGRLVKTSVPGIYTSGSRYVVVFRDSDGHQRKKFCRTLAEAKIFKATVTADKARGEIVRPSRVTVEDFFAEWLPAYTGRTSKGIKEHTKSDYADQMRLHVLPTLGRRRLADLGPRDVKRLAADLRAKGLSENSVRLALAPLRAMCADAFEDEVIRRNPCAGVTATRPRAEINDAGEERKVKALTPDELARLLAEIPATHRLLFEVLAVTGLRIGELLALQWQHIDFGRRRLLVRRRWYRGTLAPPKSKFGRRDVPLTEAMTQRLWQQRKEAHGADDALVFPSVVGTPLDTGNLYKPFKAAAKAAGVPWASFHTLRHTCATSLFRAGFNAKQVQGWLGHHAASFTLDTYIALLPDDVGEAPESFDVVALGSRLDEEVVLAPLGTPIAASVVR